MGVVSNRAQIVVHLEKLNQLENGGMISTPLSPSKLRVFSVGLCGEKLEADYNMGRIHGRLSDSEINRQK